MEKLRWQFQWAVWQTGIIEFNESRFLTELNGIKLIGVNKNSVRELE